MSDEGWISFEGPATVIFDNPTRVLPEPVATERSDDPRDDWNTSSTPAVPEVFLQWKNIDACLDFYCPCGHQTHYDGYFAYALKCAYCEQVYDMPTHLFPASRPEGDET